MTMKYSVFPCFPVLLERRKTGVALSSLLLVQLLANVRPAQSVCRVGDVQNCFRKLMQSAGNISVVNCTFYHRFKSCYLFPGCSELQTASAASVAYLTITGVHLPKELFLATMMSWSNICFPRYCQKETRNDWCHLAMNIGDQKIDLAMLDEMALLNRKVLTGRLTSTSACYTLKKTLIAWYNFRRTRCPFYRPECLCFELVSEVAHWCNVRCSYLLNSSGASSYNHQPTITIYYVLSLLITLCYE